VRAKDYAKQFNRHPVPDTIMEIANCFLRECRELIEVRRAKTDSAAIAILREQDLKWQAFARLSPGVRPDGFSQLIKHEMPLAYAAWKGERP
jgi:hypothetical protein